MMHVGPDGFGDIEPEPVNLIEVLSLELGRVRAELIRGDAAARVVDDEPQIAGPGFGRRVPTRRRAAAPDRRPTRFPIRRRESPPSRAAARSRSPSRTRSRPAQSTAAPRGVRRSASATTAASSVRSSSVARGSTVGSSGTSVPTTRTVIATTSRSPAARSAARRCVIACGLRTGHQEVAGPRVHLAQIDVLRRQQLELVERRAAGLGAGRHDALGTGQQDGEAGEEHRAGDRRRIERRAGPTDRPLPAAPPGSISPSGHSRRPRRRFSGTR